MYVEGMSLCGQKFKLYVMISIHVLAPRYSPHFQNPENIFDGKDNRVFDSHGNATTSRTLYYHATW